MAVHSTAEHDCKSGQGASARTPETIVLGRYPDVLQAAWGLNDDEFETVLRLPDGAMRKWRNHEVSFTPVTLARLRRLFLFHESLRLRALGHPPKFAAYLRGQSEPDTLIGASSILAALSDTDDQALEQLERHFRGIF